MMSKMPSFKGELVKKGDPMDVFHRKSPKAKKAKKSTFRSELLK